jgi:hypothetical protein
MSYCTSKSWGISGPAATYANSIRSSDLWERFEILRLTAAAEPKNARRNGLGVSVLALFCVPSEL